MVKMIGDLEARGAAYATSDGVYLDVSQVPDYGALAHQSLDDMLSGGGEREVLGANEKRNAADFALWKFSKPGEPSWPSPWGAGRPGWHSECVVMSLELLGEGFDLHCGGADLRFPHHENERAQAVALGRQFARHWMHNGFVVDAEGEKMSKSLGNVANLLDLLDQFDPRAYRMLLLQTHYRSPVKVGRDNIDASVKALAGLDAFAARSESLVAGGEVTPDAEVVARFRATMDNDLDTANAIALVFDTVRRANAAIDSGSPEAAPLAAAVREMCAVFGLTLGSTANVADDERAAAQQKAQALDAARTAKDFATADALRAELQGAGWLVETTKQGTTIRRA
jgi:cysteinyl-tRNA synthetase